MSLVKYVITRIDYKTHTEKTYEGYDLAALVKTIDKNHFIDENGMPILDVKEPLAKQPQKTLLQYACAECLSLKRTNLTRWIEHKAQVHTNDEDGTFTYINSC